MFVRPTIRNFLASRPLLAGLRFVFFGLFVVSLLLTTGPGLAVESLANCESSDNSEASSSQTECILGNESRLVRTRHFWASYQILSFEQGIQSAPWLTPRSLFGHRLSSELCAPLRC
ncbi:hypothetical protein Pla144_30670 [Bythopirellula polymerisocia]|uniref:Uncharacterized protein n=1 Tax=Bythopirellula polymerisocia TaxID=2528003 RepID=A0A5C6CP84_9BACT|nr:hypothetical protein Pla144_30670 [Bythopirellula polymerisocia]